MDAENQKTFEVHTKAFWIDNIHGGDMRSNAVAIVLRISVNYTAYFLCILMAILVRK